MEFTSAILLAFAIIGVAISLLLVLYVGRKEMNWIRRAFMLYCLCSAFFYSTRIMRIVGDVSFYETWGMLFTLGFGMFGVPSAVVTFSRLLTHGEKATFTPKTMTAMYLPPALIFIWGMIARPWKIEEVAIGVIPTYQGLFRIVYPIIVFGWLIFAVVNIWRIIIHLKEEKERRKMKGIRDGLLGVTVTSFFAYGVALAMGWFILYALGDVIIALFQLYIAFWYMQE